MSLLQSPWSLKGVTYIKYMENQPSTHLLSVSPYFSQFERFVPDISCQDVVAELPSFSLNVEVRLESLVVDLPGSPELDVRLGGENISTKN